MLDVGANWSVYNFNNLYYSKNNFFKIGLTRTCLKKGSRVRMFILINKMTE